MFITDITNCYGSINPQSIDWALSRKDTDFATDKNHLLASNIIQLLKELQQGRNIGIPQGSTLFDLTGEIVLGYSDLLLHKKLQEEGILDGYEILRYRDDYRVFCDNKDTLEKISFILQQVLECLNFRMNSGKTKISECIVTDSIKPDKLGYIYNTPIFNKKGCDFDGIQKHLLYILMFGRKYTNSGQIPIMLGDIDKRIRHQLKPKKRKKKVKPASLEGDNVMEGIPRYVEFEVSGKIKENIAPMCAICTQIAIENVSYAHYALRVASRLLESLEDDSLRGSLVAKISKKLCSLPNNSYYQMWLQNMTYKYDKMKGHIPYDARLCYVVMGEDVQLWNNSWLKSELTNSFPQCSVVNQETLAKVTPIITFREIRAYYEVFNEADLEQDINW